MCLTRFIFHLLEVKFKRYSIESTGYRKPCSARENETLEGWKCKGRRVGFIPRDRSGNGSQCTHNITSPPLTKSLARKINVTWCTGMTQDKHWWCIALLYRYCTVPMYLFIYLFIRQLNNEHMRCSYPLVVQILGPLPYLLTYGVPVWKKYPPRKQCCGSG